MFDGAGYPLWFQGEHGRYFGYSAWEFLFFVCIALGLGTLLASATTVYAVFRIAGAIYLFYLGLRTILSTFRRSSTRAAQIARPLPAHGNLFFQGLLIQITNPKALLFVSALLPQFIDPHRPVLLQLVILVLTTIAVDSMGLASYAFLAQRGFQSLRASRWFERVSVQRLSSSDFAFYSLESDGAHQPQLRGTRGLGAASAGE